MTRNIAFVIAIAAGAAAVAAALAMTSGKAFADDITIDPTPFTSSRSRAEVRSELMRNDVNEWTMQFNDARLPTGYTRRQATAEYIAAREEVKALDAEDSGSAYLGRKSVGVNSRAILGAPGR